MNRKLFLAFLAVLPLATGCVIGGGGHSAQYGDVTFAWTFTGQDCSAVPNVQSVRIAIPGEPLQNDGVYPCTSNGYPGIVLHDFAPGTYSYTIQGLDASGQTIYTGSGTFAVNGNVLVSIDLTPVGSPTSWAYLTWSFPSSPGITAPCDDRHLVTVTVQIDNMAAENFGCNAGLANPGNQGVQTNLILAGNHTIQFWVIDNQGQTIIYKSSTLTTYGGSPSSQTYAFQQSDWVVGGIALKWSLLTTANGAAVTCSQAGVDTLYVNFQSTQSPNNTLYGPLGDYTQWDRIDHFCTQGFQYAQWSYLPPGTYWVYMTATGSGGTYTSSTTNPLVITVAADVYPDPNSAPSVSLVKQ